jgi:hypothetical protein
MNDFIGKVEIDCIQIKIKSRKCRSEDILSTLIDLEHNVKCSHLY